jgi:CelD/BcsL family acetyltransferase involved in cellulose biosynthesis
VRIQVYTDETLFDTLKPEWNALLQRSRANHIFLTWEWQHTWWQSYHPGDLHVVTFRDTVAGEDTLLGIASCFLMDLPQRGRTMRFVGCVEVTDYLEIIAAADHEEAVFAAFTEYLMGEGTDHWNALDFCNIREQSPTLEHLPPLLKAHGLEVNVKFEDVCPVVDLPETWDEYLDMLDGKQRRELRRKMRRAAGSGLDWRIVSDADDLDAEMTSFLHLMESSATEKAEFMADPQNRDFFAHLAPVLMGAGWLQLIFIDLRGEPIAAYLNFDYGNRVQVYNSGIDPEHYRLSPGWVLLGYAIEHAIEHGRTEFDFLQGDEEYKYRMGGEDVKVWMLMADKP